MFRDCRVIRGEEGTDAEPADVAAALAARAARSFVAPITLPLSESSFAVGERINARRDRNPYDEDEHRETWLSGVVERVRRGGKYDVQHDGGPYERGLPAATLRKEGPGDGLILVGRESGMSGDQESAVIELQVLNTEGKWQPARTLYEYVQQNVVEICSVWDEQNPADAPEPVDDGCEPAWWNASEVYEKHLHRVEFGPIATLLDGITPRFAGYIVERRRAEVAGTRLLRVAAQRARVPLEVAKIIEKCKGAVISNTGFAVCKNENKDQYAYQRSAKNAGRILGYSNFWFVSTANDCMRHRQLEETGTFDPFTNKEIHYASSCWTPEETPYITSFAAANKGGE